MRKEAIKKELSKLNIGARSIRLLPSGAMRNTYLIDTNKEKYILKIFDKSKKASIQKVIKILNKINSKKEITINPINKKVLSFGNSAGFIYPFFEGEVFEKLSLPNKLKIFGKIVGEFNSITLKLSKIRTKNPKRFIEEETKKFKRTMKLLLDNNGGYFNEIMGLFERGISLIENSKNYSVRVCLIHGDLNFQNVLYNLSKKEYRIIDCLNVGYGFLPKEIAVVISHLVTKDSAKNKKIIKEVLGAYSSKVRMTKNELKSIPLFMLVYKMGEVNWLVTEYNNKRISKSVFEEFMRIDAKQLKKIMSQFENLNVLF